MAGIGPPPNDSDRLVNKSRAKNRDAVMRIVTALPSAQPPLPEEGWVLSSYSPDAGWSSIQMPWPKRTREWWAMWGDSPLMDDATANDWSELLDTAVIHARHWTGDPKAAAELRQRVAKFGATPEDRARLRIQFAGATRAEAEVAVPGAGQAPAAGRTGPRRLTDDVPPPPATGTAG